MHRCSSSHGNSSYSPCSSCGFFQAPTNSAFSMFFSMPNHQQQQVYEEVDHTHAHAYPYASSSSSSVDCTLSLGTPSTRQTSYNFMDHHHSTSSNNHHRSSSSSTTSGSKKLSWDIFQTKKPSSSSSSSAKSNKGGNNTNNLTTGDPLLARRCANCDTTSTPLWRNGPRGPKSLCNACGIRYKKEERRAANNSSITTTNSSTTATTMMDPHHYMGHHHHMNTWAHQGNEFRFIEDNESDSADNAIPSFLSWRLNVPADRASLVHDYS